MRNPNSLIALIFLPLTGTGSGSGKAIPVIICGLAIALVGLVAYTVQPILGVETNLPDHDMLEKAAVIE